MPPAYYLPLHPTAKPTDPEQQALIQGLTNSFGADNSRGGDIPAAQVAHQAGTPSIGPAKPGSDQTVAR